MGYFPNGTASSMYEQRYCESCIHYGPDEGPGCPVWLLHLMYSSDQCRAGERGEALSHVLGTLIPRTEDGIGNEQCRLYHPDKDDRRTLPLFPEVKP